MAMAAADPTSDPNATRQSLNDPAHVVHDFLQPCSAPDQFRHRRFATNPNPSVCQIVPSLPRDPSTRDFRESQWPAWASRNRVYAACEMFQTLTQWFPDDALAEWSYWPSGLTPVFAAASLMPSRRHHPVWTPSKVMTHGPLPSFLHAGANIWTCPGPPHLHLLHTPLHLAIALDRVPAVQLLIASGAPVWLPNGQGVCPLIYLAARRHFSHLKLRGRSRSSPFHPQDPPPAHWCILLPTPIPTPRYNNHPFLTALTRGLEEHVVYRDAMHATLASLGLPHAAACEVVQCCFGFHWRDPEATRFLARWRSVSPVVTYESRAVRACVQYAVKHDSVALLDVCDVFVPCARWEDPSDLVFNMVAPIRHALINGSARALVWLLERVPEERVQAVVEGLSWTTLVQKRATFRVLCLSGWAGVVKEAVPEFMERHRFVVGLRDAFRAGVEAALRAVDVATEEENPMEIVEVIVGFVMGELFLKMRKPGIGGPGAV